MPPRGGLHGVAMVASVGSDPLNDMRPHQGNARSGREGVGASSASCCRGCWGHGVVADRPSGEGSRRGAVHRCKARPMQSSERDGGTSGGDFGVSASWAAALWHSLHN